MKNLLKNKFIRWGIVVIMVIVLFTFLVKKKSVGERPPPDYYTYTNLPQLSEWKKQSYCRMSPEKKEQYYQEKLAEAKILSDKLEAYIRDWYYGKASAELPAGLLPPSIENEKTKNWRLSRPEEVKAEDQWYIRPANEIPEDFGQLYFLSPDNHVSYFKLIFIAPFDSQLLIEGDFPHARFMDYQVLEPFDPQNPTTSGLGAPEVPIVDIDIEPDPGHVNPFRVSGDRNAKERHYHLTFELKAGNAVTLNPQAMQIPQYRAPGNTRVGGPFAFSGPNGNGAIIASVLWMRYYAPDRNTGPLAGVGYPKAVMRLRTGEEFWLQPDFSLAAERQNIAAPGYETPPKDPPDWMGPNVGWFKFFSFWRIIADGFWMGLVKPWSFLPKRVAENWINSRGECYFSRGASMPPPGNYETSASGMNYNTYLARIMSLGKNKAYILTGKLPQTPETRNSEPTATTGEARYWSICHMGNGEDKKYPALLYGCLMDDEILTDEENSYIVVFSRGSERPSNAKPECGVTWQDYGPESWQVFTLRWMSVMPDDYLPEHAPHQNNIPWETGEWSSPHWDPSIMSYNNQEGFMGEYQPLVHYLTKEEFESLGCPIDPQKIPLWE